MTGRERGRRGGEWRAGNVNDVDQSSSHSKRCREPINATKIQKPERATRSKDLRRQASDDYEV